jgi:hypothetical protein
MTVFLGSSGYVQLRRSTPPRIFTSLVDPGDVNAAKNRFSFDFPSGMLLTGDRLKIKSTTGVVLAFIAASGWSGGSQLADGQWYINVDELGGIRLYDTFSNSLNGTATGRVSLAAITSSIPISVQSVEGQYQILGLVKSYELNNDREVVDVTSLSDEFRQKESSLISGNGQISCEFHYQESAATGITGPSEVTSYLHQLLLRQKLGAEFDARLFIVAEGKNFDSPTDSLWFEFKGVITSAAISLGTGQITLSNFGFVTTGEIEMKVGKGSLGYVLQEDASRLLLEQDATAKLELEHN